MNLKPFIVATVAALPLLASSTAAGYPPPKQKTGEKKKEEEEKPVIKTEEETTYETYALGRPWLPDKGIMLRPMTPLPEKDQAPFIREDGSIDSRRTLPYDIKDKGLCITLKLQDDYAPTDGKAGPATFNWVKDAGESGQWDVDAALRADFWIPDFYHGSNDTNDAMEMSVALGYEVRRLETDDPKEEIDQQAFHLSLPFVPAVIFKHVPFLDLSKADQVFQADITYLDDDVSGDSGFDFETDWKPVFKLPFFNGSQAPGTTAAEKSKGMWVGVRCSMEADTLYEPLDTGKVPDRFYYLIDPKIGVSYGDRYSLGSPLPNTSMDSEAVLTYSLGLKIGGPISWGGKMESNYATLVEFGYTFKGGSVLSDDGSFVHHELGLHIQPAQATNQISFDVTYENGKDGFAKKSKVEQVKVGLGVRF